MSVRVRPPAPIQTQLVTRKTAPKFKSAFPKLFYVLFYFEGKSRWRLKFGEQPRTMSTEDRSDFLGHDGKPLPPSACPSCGHLMDAAMCISKPAGRPEPGDLSLCLKCGEILVYADQLKLRTAELNDLMRLDKKRGRRLSRAQTLIRFKRYVS